MRPRSEVSATSPSVYTQVLHLSEGSAYNRIETARAARRYPEVLDALERGDLTLTAVRMLAPHLTFANHTEVLAAARHRSKQGIQELIASLNPCPEAATIIRRVAAQSSKSDSAPAFAAAQELQTSVATTARHAAWSAVLLAMLTMPGRARPHPQHNEYEADGRGGGDDAE